MEKAYEATLRIRKAAERLAEIDNGIEARRQAALRNYRQARAVGDMAAAIAAADEILRAAGPRPGRRPLKPSAAGGFIRRGRLIIGRAR